MIDDTREGPITLPGIIQVRELLDAGYIPHLEYHHALGDIFTRRNADMKRTPRERNKLRMTHLKGSTLVQVYTERLKG